MRPLILRLFSAAKLLLMFELNKFLFLILNDLSGFTGLSGNMDRWNKKRRQIRAGSVNYYESI
jgi:hypothetical protein